MRFLGAPAMAITAISLLLATAGCGGPARTPVGKVSGTVTYRGQPLKAGTIIFLVPGARQATGKVVDGKITEVTTFQPNDGAPIGQAKIAVFAAQTAEQGAKTPGNPGSAKMGGGYMGAGNASLIPSKYNKPASSGLTCEIKKGESNVVTLKLSGQ